MQREGREALVRARCDARKPALCTGLRRQRSVLVERCQRRRLERGKSILDRGARSLEAEEAPRRLGGRAARGDEAKGVPSVILIELLLAPSQCAHVERPDIAKERVGRVLASQDVDLGRLS